MTYDLAIGERAYSSWSLRGWLMFEKFGLPVKVHNAKMYTPDFARTLAAFGAARLVPAMRKGEVVVWDSLAMAETLAEAHPDKGLWPADPALRGLARSLVAEMHSGFNALRSACPMNLLQAYEGGPVDADIRADLDRIAELWALAPGGDGPWLFGAYSLADVFYAPVAMRIAGYGLRVPAPARAYVDTHLADPAFRRWRAMALAENRVIDGYLKDLLRVGWPGPRPLPAEAVEGAPVNDRCPYSGDPVAADSLARIDGVTVGFCNPFCRDKTVADPEAWPAAMALVRGR